MKRKIEWAEDEGTDRKQGVNEGGRQRTVTAFRIGLQESSI